MASSTTMMTGNAVMLAAEDAKKKPLEAASAALKQTPKELEIENGMIQVKGMPEPPLFWTGKIIRMKQ